MIACSSGVISLRDCHRVLNVARGVDQAKFVIDLTLSETVPKSEANITQNSANGLQERSDNKFFRLHNGK